MIVSIITPIYNSEKYIFETYTSICNQTIIDWEWILVDDNSFDNTIEIIKGFAINDDRVKIYKNSGAKGPGNCRNIGIFNAKGRYLTFIDSDDYWFPNFLEKSISTIIEENCAFVFSSYERWDENLEVKFNSFVVPKKMTYNKLLYTCPISC